MYKCKCKKIKQVTSCSFAVSVYEINNLIATVIMAVDHIWACQ